MHHSHRNLIKPYHTEETTVRGLTITPTTNGVRVQGTASVEYPIRLSSQEVRYLEKDKIYAFSLYINGDISGCKDPYLGYNDGITYRSIQNLTELNSYSYIWTVPERYSNAVNPWFDMYIRVKENSTVDFEIGLKMEEGSYVTAYEPYSGETIPIEFPATKNLLDATKVSRNIGGATFSYSEGTWKFENCGTGNGSAVWGSQIFPAGTYTIKATCDREGVRGYRLLCSSSSCGGQWLDWYGGYFIDSSNGTDKITFTTTEEFSVGLCFLNNSQHPSSPGTLKDIQLERGSSATPYEPYGTVYGGYVDLVRGKLVAEYALACAKKSEFGDKTTPSSGGMEYRQTGNLYPRSEAGTTWSTARQQQKFNLGVIANPWSESSYGNNIGVLVTQDPVNTTYMRISEVVYQAMGEDDYAMMSYKLETPIEYDITPQILKTLKGTNNIWADTNGNIEVSYWTH